MVKSAFQCLENVSAETAADFLQSVVSAVPDAVITIDRAGTIESFSPSAESMFGYAAAEVIGQNVSVLMPAPHRERHDQYLAHYHETGERRIIGIGRVTTARRQDGTTFPIELSVSEMEVAGRRVYTGFIRDLGKLSKGHRRYHDLQAEEADVVRVTQLGGLASAIAHELNQPLSAATNYAEVAQVLMERSGDDAAALAAIRDCAAETERAGRIVQRLRQLFARGEIVRTRVSFDKLVGEAAAMVLAGNRRESSALRIEANADGVDVLGDRVQLQQVVSNLLRNALEAVGSEPNQVVRARTRAISADFAELIIDDSGHGIDQESAERLFHPLRTTKPGGMGLGLSICQQIVTGHGGDIWFEQSELGGAAFHVRLPRFPAEAAAA